MYKTILKISFVVAAMIGVAGCSHEKGAPEKTASAGPTTRQGEMRFSTSGRIEAIDYATREVTLKGADGKTETFVVGDQVQRLNEAKVGDSVRIDYYLGMAAELRKPTAEEAQNPLVVTEAAGRTGTGSAPAAGGARQIRAVCTIEALDKSQGTITVKGPRGRSYRAFVANPANFDKMHVGDTIVITFTEAAAVSLEKAGQ
jgi:hypothetical protein